MVRLWTAVAVVCLWVGVAASQSILDDTGRVLPKGHQKSLVSAASKGFNDPKSAQIRNIRKSSKTNDIWCGEINAKNSAGGYVAFRPFLYDQRDRKAVVLPDSEVSNPGGFAILIGGLGCI